MIITINRDGLQPLTKQTQQQLVELNAFLTFFNNFQLFCLYRTQFHLHLFPTEPRHNGREQIKPTPGSDILVHCTSC